VLGVGLIDAGVGGPEGLREGDAEASSVPSRFVQPGTTASLLAIEDQTSVAPACPQEHPHLSRPLPPDLEVIGEDPREYLRAMAASRPRRQGDAASMSDPYQASLNPTVYLISLEKPRH
jgi:hypothetical protein